MGEYKEMVENIKNKNKDLIDKRLTKVLSTAEDEKSKYMKIIKSLSDTTDKIKAYVAKFDKLKEEMNVNGKRFE